ncbi:MAG TPA: PfkB family carbohydrate kinase [Gemmatimonadales bacterium]|jgi:fructokinase|nr:PfkB family carbohydrate kinase [Gemmatimonadales bacterium]
MTQPVVVGLGEALWDVLPDGDHFGGAPANVALHAAALGAESWLVSAVGQDARGDAALARLDAAGVRRDTVARLADHPTGVVRVTLDAAGHPVYDIATESACDYLPWSEAVRHVAERADAIAFGSLAQRSPTSRATIRRAVATTRGTSWRLFDVNLRQTYYDAGVLATSLELANAVKLNDEELPVVAQLCGVRAAAPVDQLRALCDRFGLRLAALTRGACGALLVTPDEVCESAAPPTVVADTVGAGDAFTAALLIGVLAGCSLDAVSRRANAVASYVCSQPGATPPIPESLR